MSFEKLELIKPIQRALLEEGYTIPTPIQRQAIPVILAGKDLLGCAQTGTGKTAAFALPILQILSAGKSSHNGKSLINSLILTPTRELAIQIDESFSAYGKYTGLKNTVIFGGVSQKTQTDKLRQGVDILIATPGRLLDLMNQNYINLKNIKIFVLDEADRMLDMGFIHDVKKIISNLPGKRQSLFFSATMPSEIVKLSRTILTDPIKIEITPENPTIEAIKQSVYFVSKPNKRALLIHLLKDKSIASALIFTRTKHGADHVSKFLNQSKIHAEAIHGNKSQNARQRALSNFKSKLTRVLVATDIAARGIDINELSHVINYEIPNISETYIHRIGRTGRAGLSGVAISFCDVDERAYLKDINKLINTQIPVINDHPFHMDEREPAGTETISRKPPVTVQKNYRQRHLSGLAPKGKKKWVPKQFSSKGKV
ncbi:MAG: DEAD/DEAH box helicase [Ignavibacteriaceae bacterium]|nr:DEAD/DEAH box helicase [Ignavibacteriaceae bacterium]